jgi:DNA-binding transcriptional ArsR family regulator
MLNQTTIPYKPDENRIIQDLETLKVVSDPLRLQVLEILRQPGTVKQVATQLDIAPTKLYYHFNLLEKHDLIRVVDTQIVSGIIEKHFQVAARCLCVDNALLSPGAPDFVENLSLTLTSLFESNRVEAIQSVTDGVCSLEDDAEKYRSLDAMNRRLNLDPEQAEAFYTRLEALIDEFTISQPQFEDRDDVQMYRLFYMLYPSSRHRTNRDIE